VRRLWGLDDATVDAVLAALEDERFLRRTSDDTYARVGVDV
jgi:DNA-binding IclR family transcriptional regulator